MSDEIAAPVPTPPTLRERLEVIRRRSGISITTFLLVMVAAVPFILALPALYRAHATVIVQSTGPTSDQPGAVGGFTENRLQAIKQEAFTRARLSHLVEQFDLYPDLRRAAAEEAVLARLERDIDVEVVSTPNQMGQPSTVAFHLTYLGLDPQTAAAVANTLASFYVAQNERIRSQQASRTAEVLGQQVEDIRNRLQEQNRRVMSYTTRNSGSLPQQFEANTAALNRLNMELRLNAEEQMKLIERRQTLQSDLATLDTQASSAATDPRARLSALRNELAALRMTHTDAHPDVRRLTGEIASLEAKLADAPAPAGGGKAEPAPATHRATLQRALDETEQQLEQLTAQSATLRQEIRTREGQLEQSAVRGPELDAISRDYQTTRELYDTLMRRFDEARLAVQSEQAEAGQEFRILDPAVPPTTSVGPNRNRLLFGAMILAFCLAIGVGFVVDRLDGAFHSVEELRAFTRVPVLASIPVISTAGDSRRRGLKAAGVVCASAVVLLVVAFLATQMATGNEQMARLLLRMG